MALQVGITLRMAKAGSFCHQHDVAIEARIQYAPHGAAKGVNSNVKHLGPIHSDMKEGAGATFPFSSRPSPDPCFSCSLFADTNSSTFDGCRFLGFRRTRFFSKRTL